MGRRVSGVGLVLALALGLVVGAGAAGAQESCWRVRGICLDDATGPIAGPAPAPAPPPGTGGIPGSAAMWEAVVDTDAEGQPCWRIVSSGSHTGKTAAQAEAEGATMGIARCVDFTSPAENWWEIIELPDAQPTVQPGNYALTGAKVFLVMEDAEPFEEERTSPFGTTFEISVTPRFTIHWGDGTTTDTDSPGQRWPGGADEVAHRYRRRGVVDIRVVTTWRAQVVRDGVETDLPQEFEQEATIADYPVREVQAVRYR